MNRLSNLKKLPKTFFDVFIVGGGSSGASTLACLAAQGFKVGLIDRNDFASGTSQESSNLIWGGIKYLENFEFGLVRKLCQARNRLLKYFPDSVKEIRFYSPHEKKAKHSLLKLYFGTWFYWLWGGRATSPPKKYRLPGALKLGLKQENLDGIFEYSDAYLPENDARFVFDFVKQAHRKGAVVANYVLLEKATYVQPQYLQPQYSQPQHSQPQGSNGEGGYWELSVLDKVSQRRFKVKTKAFVNAGGARVDEINLKNKIKTKHQHLFSKGVHVVVKKLFHEEKVLTFFSSDNRLFFAIPMGGRTCIGTTDEVVSTPEAKATKEDISFILSNVNNFVKLKKPLTMKDVIATRAGVRPLVREISNQGGSAGEKANPEERGQSWFNLSRKHSIEVDERKYFSIFGGKLTDTLNIAEEITEKILALWVKSAVKSAVKSSPKPAQGSLKPWLVLPDKEQKANFSQEFVLASKNKGLAEEEISLWVERLWRRYRSEAGLVLRAIRREKPFLKEIVPGSGFSVGEIKYQLKNEMVVQEEDLLRRRTMLALVVEREKLKKVKLSGFSRKFAKH